MGISNINNCQDYFQQSLSEKRWMGSLNTRRHTEKMECMGKDVFGNDFFNCSVLHYASKVVVCAAINIVCLRKNGGIRQNLLVAKSRIAPKKLTIRRLELIAAHTLAKLAARAKLSLTESTFKEINLWTDSMATLYWLLNRGTWSRYVRNRLKAINDHAKFTWRYVSTDQNPSDLGTRGISIVKLNEFWFKCPNWLSNEIK